MVQEDRSKEELVEELKLLQKRIADLEVLDGERKKGEDVLRASEKRFRTLFEQSKDAIFIADSETRMLIDCNLQGEKLTGRSRQDILLMRADELHPKESVDRTMEIFKKQVDGEDIIGESLVLTKDGKRVPVSINSAVIEIDGKKSIVGIFRDITERKSAQWALDASEKKFRAIFDNTTDGIVVTEFESKEFNGVNKSMCRMLGYSLEEFLMLGVADIHPKEEMPYVLEQIEKQSKDASMPAVDLPVKRKDGSVFYANVLGTKMNLLGKDYMVAIFRDITERKRAEDALRESEGRLKDIMSNMADWVWEVDENGVYTYSSHKGSDFFGRTDEEIVGKTPFDFMSPDEAKRVAAIFSEIIALKAPIKDLENWNITKSGEKICLLTNGVPILDDAGNLKGYRGVDKDITDRKQAEGALRQSEEKYRSIVDNIGIGVALISPEMEVLSLNSQMKKWNPHVDLQKKNICYRVFNNPSREEICSYCPTVKTLKDGLVHEDITETPMGGQVFNYRIVSTPIRGEDGKIVAAIEMVEDITERKKLEEEAKKRLRDLEVFYKASVGREERILELKKEIGQLKNELGK